MVFLAVLRKRANVLNLLLTHVSVTEFDVISNGYSFRGREKLQMNDGTLCELLNKEAGRRLDLRA